jgi:hypothetical protein
VVIEGVFLTLNIRSLSWQILVKTEEEAVNLSETIRLSIRNAMIKDRRDEYQRIIDDVVQRKGIVEVRIFNKQGEITVSSDKLRLELWSINRPRPAMDVIEKEKQRSFSHQIARPVSIIQKREVFLD